MTAAALADLGADPDPRSHSSGRPERRPPAGVDQIEFFVPGYAGRSASRVDLARMPALKVIQVLTAGVEPWLDRVPAGVVLCSGRGIHGGSTAELAVAGILSHLRRAAAVRRRPAAR